MEAFVSDTQDSRYEIGWPEIIQSAAEIGILDSEGLWYYGIPKNGLICLLYLSAKVAKINVAVDPYGADYLLDDIYDSGETAQRYREKYKKPVIALFNKKHNEKWKNKWLVMPWETDEAPAEDSVVRMLEAIGEDPKRDGLIDTPKRVVKSWEKLYGGYKEDPKKILAKTFKEKSDQMVVLKDIEIYSTCEHHLLPFHGRCHVAYIPKDKVVGISKLARLAECFARRLQIQERLTNQIAQSIREALDPKGVGVVIEAQHFCMTSRGVEKQHSKMLTSSRTCSYFSGIDDALSLVFS